jgi:hypothetical protein
MTSSRPRGLPNFIQITRAVASEQIGIFRPLKRFCFLTFQVSQASVQPTLRLGTHIYHTNVRNLAQEFHGHISLLRRVTP